MFEIQKEKLPVDISNLNLDKYNYENNKEFIDNKLNITEDFITEKGIF